MIWLTHIFRKKQSSKNSVREVEVKFIERHLMVSLSFVLIKVDYDLISNTLVNSSCSDFRFPNSGLKDSARQLSCYGLCTSLLVNLDSSFVDHSEVCFIVLISHFGVCSDTRCACNSFCGCHRHCMWTDKETLGEIGPTGSFTTVQAYLPGAL